MKKLLYILLSVLFFACKPQKLVTEYKYINKTDTLVRTQINTIYKGITDTIMVENPCDSTGIINHFYSKFVLPNGTITLSSERKSNRLKAIVHINDNISTSESKIQSRSSESIATKEKEIIKYKTPSWVFVVIFVETIIILLYLYMKFILK